ncbi:hypothetical protein [Leeuwenhoekiella sp. MAR_2009_132]|uniref:hypothetical protein n=1 Tax=Leeuwenhoekiella sp. MAR_2009_132 TaxID=1392489 RepID=UPI000491E1D3|nr:hypothetical protein [Leeuwenhoekiella sp. MAR_2009_132]
MIKKVKRILEEFRGYHKKTRYHQTQLWAAEQLRGLFSSEHYIPYTNWTMNPRAILHAINIITLTKVNNLIEFGSGATTIYLAKAIKMQNLKVSFYSIESDKEWIEILRLQLKKLDLDQYVKLIYVPLKPMSKDLTFKNQEIWFDAEILSEELPKSIAFDFVIVDGPFGASTPYARFSAYPFLNAKTTKKTIWLLDDTNRPKEKEILKEWMRLSNLNAVTYERYSIMQEKEQFYLEPYKLQ